MPRVSYAAKVIAAAVTAKALLMGVLVSLLAASFAQSVVLVLVSATATGIFGLLIVLIQVHAERSLHARIDSLEATGRKTAEVTEAVAATTAAVAEATGAQPNAGGA